MNACLLIINLVLSLMSCQEREIAKSWAGGLVHESLSVAGACHDMHSKSEISHT